MCKQFQELSLTIGNALITELQTVRDFLQLNFKHSLREDSTMQGSSIALQCLTPPHCLFCFVRLCFTNRQPTNSYTSHRRKASRPTTSPLYFWSIYRNWQSTSCVNFIDEERRDKASGRGFAKLLCQVCVPRIVNLQNTYTSGMHQASSQSPHLSISLNL